MSSGSHDDARPDPRPPHEDGIVEKFDGVRTKFGRRERRTADRLTKNARVRNSYLKIVMEDAVFDQLHDLVRGVRRRWEESESDDPLPVEDDRRRRATVSKKQSKRRLTIEPRSRNSLHMTYFFAGKVLEEMSGEELRRWEHFVRNCVSERRDGDAESPSAGDRCLRFESLATFPPGRQNLIVAAFESSPALDDLHERLCDVAVMEKECDRIAGAASGRGKEYEFPLLRGLTRKQQRRRGQRDSPRWVAHVTLGNLAGGSREDVRRLSEWLGNVNHADITGDNSVQSSSSALELTSNASSESNSDAPLANPDRTCIFESNVDALGLALGGPVPEHE
eukprot:CAMPEP_0172538416 /NCGR_PEP_ID=MMETSP1067-20121228/9805_1 /TAXON_ID=265564 ORGANISM="Thalassiosira punctigera, Strain Tpunct2005C2" /NCGR_SAMPLE_ID=MMETSP1067 /ASSEMBLY_ACC=CAM_ASM_000444 /LENGTH=335 /DNA_ID=CAMNT_0013323907 /DNA_START=581 /DNA_END=1585 /DNA_ORIENTATION=+